MRRVTSTLSFKAHLKTFIQTSNHFGAARLGRDPRVTSNARKRPLRHSVVLETKGICSILRFPELKYNREINLNISFIISGIAPSSTDAGRVDCRNRQQLGARARLSRAVTQPRRQG